MAKKNDWEFIKSEYEETDKSIRCIANENGVSHTTIQNRIKSEKWNRSTTNTDSVNLVVTRSKSIGKVAKRKIDEIASILGKNYLPSYEPLIVVFACNYQMWIEMKAELDVVGIIHKTSKGTKQLSTEFRALKEIEKTLKDIGSELGLSVTSGMKLGLSNPVPDTEKSSIFDLNKKRSVMDVNV